MTSASPRPYPPVSQNVCAAVKFHFSFANVVEEAAAGVRNAAQPQLCVPCVGSGSVASPKPKGSLLSPPPPPLTLLPPSDGSASSTQLALPRLQPPQPTRGGTAPGPLRVISEAPSVSVQSTAAHDETVDGSSAQKPLPQMLKTPPLICEQGPSAPSSPTSPGGGRIVKRPCPLSVDALQRFDLLSPNYVPSHQLLTAMDGNKLSPMSPAYPTSDLGSSPRSSISIHTTHSNTWHCFRDARKKSSAGSSDYDGDSDIYSGKSDFLSPGQLFSPAPFSPFSDYCASASETPYSSRSPNLSPLPHLSNLHFSFDQVRSRSSMSNRNGVTSADCNGLTAGGSGGVSGGGIMATSRSPYRRRPYHNRDRHSPMHPRSLDSEARERSRSEGEMLKKARDGDDDEDDDEEDGMNASINHSTYSVPVRSNHHRGGTGQYKKRLLHKYRSEQANNNNNSGVTAVTQLSVGSSSDASSCAVGPSAASTAQSSQEEPSEGAAAGSAKKPPMMSTRQPTIEEPPPSPTFAELFHSRDLGKERQQQVEEWIRQQAVALEVFRNSLVPLRQESNHLQVPQSTLVPQNSMEQLSQILAVQQQHHQQHHHHQQQQQQAQSQVGPLPSPSMQNMAPGPMKPATLWRRSRSESDVSVPINDAAFICEHCGQGFAMHDRLAKHIASRHRDRSASVNDENNKIHKCKLCPKSFGRSDMLTRHMRLHTGVKPYSCQICGQVFSRSDHLSTHQRTHTGEKPYRCPHCSYAASRRDMITRHMRTHLRPDGSPIPFNELQIPIAQLSLNQPPTPEPSADHRSVSPYPLSGGASPRVASPAVPGVGELPPFSSDSGSSENNFSSDSSSMEVEVEDSELRPPGNAQVDASVGVSGTDATLLTVTNSESSRTLGASTPTSRRPSAALPPLPQNTTANLNALSALFLRHHQAILPTASEPTAKMPDVEAAARYLAAMTNQSTAAGMFSALGGAPVAGPPSLVPSLPPNQLTKFANALSADVYVPSEALRRSTPNLLGTGDHPSAFRPLGGGPAPSVNGLYATATANGNVSASVTLSDAVSRLLAASSTFSHQPKAPNFLPLNGVADGGGGGGSAVTSPVGGVGFGALLRQQSIGGFGFVDAPNTNNG